VTDERRAKALAAISSMAEDLKEVVEDIENGVPFTQGNYDKYAMVIEQMSNGKNGMKFAVALALMEAGANVNGVRAAISLTAEVPQ